MIVLVLRITNSYELATQSIKFIIWIFCAVCMKQVAENVLKCGEKTDSFCTTIMRLPTMHLLFGSFKPNIQQIRLHKLRIHRTWRRVSFSYFYGWNFPFVVTVFSTLIRFKKILQELWRNFTKSSLRHVLKIGKIIGRRASQTEENILKEME